MNQYKKDTDQVIPVVFCLDKLYLFQAFVVMHSILKNSDTYYHFIVISKDNIEDNMDILLKNLQKYYKNFSLFSKKIDPNLFVNVKIFNSHIVEAAFYRLTIPELLIEYKKCIYLDCDVFVNGDLKELFRMDLENNYVAGVRDCHLISQHITKHQQSLGIPSLENYINSGVLLMNLEKMRKDKLVSRFLKQAEKDNLYEDQDILNFCCYGHIKTLPLKYNLFHFYMGNTIRKLFDSPFYKQDFAFDWNNPFILHMGGLQKPWINRKFKGAEKWWELAEIYRDSDLYKRYRTQVSNDDNKIIRKVFDICKNNKNVILWGFSDQGKDVCDVLLRKGIVIKAFCDNNKHFKEDKYRGIPVKDAKITVELNPDAVWIITCKKSFQEVFVQLIRLGIKNEKIIFFTYNSRGETYFRALDPDFYDNEIETIALLENDTQKMSDEQYLIYLRKMLDEKDLSKEKYRYLYYKYRLDLWLEG